MKRSRLVVAALTVLVAATLAGCTPVVAMDPAEDSNNPQCADVIVRLPQELQGQARRETNAQATGAWGDPTSILLRCGVEVPAASTLQCVDVGGVSWLWDDSDAPTYTFRTFGREPAIDVALDRDVVAPEAVLDDLSRLIDFTTPNGLSCSGDEEEQLPE